MKNVHIMRGKVQDNNELQDEESEEATEEGVAR